jgi:tetratricopeptide (TPR) repeat protein
MPSPPDKDAIEEISSRFLLRVAEAHARAHPGDLDALRELAYAYTSAGRLEDALATDRELVAREPLHADLHYDLACSFALLGRSDDAFASLARALDLGFDALAILEADEDLHSLRADPRWSTLLARLRGDAPPSRA